MIAMLNVTCFGYDNNNIDSLIDTLKQNPEIKKLVLFRNNINGETLIKLVNALMELHHLQDLNLGDNNIGDNDLSTLVPLVSKGLLKTLVLTSNSGITEDSIKIIQAWQKKGISIHAYHTNLQGHIPSDTHCLNGIPHSNKVYCAHVRASVLQSIKTIDSEEVTPFQING